jgi:hypothetical protein
MKKILTPALVLWFLAPVFGELFSGSTPLNEYLSPITIVLFGMLYGSGAILIRELVVRWKKSWPSLILLGLAYGIFEEGLMVRSFFDPGWSDLGQLGIYGRPGEVNWVWAEHLSIYHALISIAASIVFVEILFPARRAEPWIGTRGLVWNALCLAATLPVGAWLNPYETPDLLLGMCWLVIAALTLAAWRIPATAPVSRVTRVPSPGVFFGFAFLATLGQFFLLYFTGEKEFPPFLVTMLLLALYDLSLLWLVRRWNGNFAAWDDRHRIALINGSLTFFLLLGPLTIGGEYPIMAVSNPFFFFTLLWFAHKTDQRVNAELAAQSTSR